MTNNDIIELEKRIHLGRFETKETVYYQNLQGKNYLVILHIQSLPEAKDDFGRGGIFLCHGFIFPPELWTNVSNPLRLFELVKDQLFTNREDILSSELTDKKTGNIKPIEVSEKKLTNLPKDPPQLTTDFEWKIVILLNRFASSVEKTTIVFKGEPEAVSSLMNKAIAYIPNDLKIAIGWDSAFESGRLGFYPLKIVGFKHDRPLGGNSINIDIDSSWIQTSPATSIYFLPHTSYEKWLIFCRGKAISKKQIEENYKLSLMLDTGISVVSAEVPVDKSSFISANQKQIQDVFLVRCKKAIGASIASCVTEVLNPHMMIDILIENFPLEKIAGIVEQGIIQNSFTSEAIDPHVFRRITEVGSKRLKLIEKVWNKDILDSNDLKILDRQEKLEFIKYLLLTKWKDRDWTLAILRNEDEETFMEIFSSSDTKKSIECILLKLISKEKGFRGIEKYAFDEIKKQKKEFHLLRKKVNLVEEILAPIIIGKRFTSKSKEIDTREILDLLIIAKNKKLKLIGKLWGEDFLEGDDLKVLNIEEKLEFIGYLLLTEWEDRDWTLAILREEKKFFRRLLSYSNTENVIKKILRRIISSQKVFYGIEELMLKAVMKQSKEFYLLRDEIKLEELLELLENYIKNIHWAADSPGFWCRVRSWLSDHPVKIDEPININKSEDKEFKKEVIKCLTQYHGYNIKDFKRLGFNEDDLLKIEKRIKRNIRITKLKEIFGFKKK